MHFAEEDSLEKRGQENVQMDQFHQEIGVT